MRKTRRTTLLLLALIMGGAANDFGPDDAPGVSHFTPTGAFGAYLAGRFAVHSNDMDMAADEFRVVMNEDPAVPEVATQAFIAATLAGRPEAVAMAATQLDNPVALLLLANEDAGAGRWDAAVTRLQALPSSSLTQVLQPLLLAWAEAGQSRTEAALLTLQPAIDDAHFRGVMTLHAALIADLGGQTNTAADLYRRARTENTGLNLRLGLLLASWEARQGLMSQAQQTLRDMAGMNGDIVLARPALEASVNQPVIRNATDGMAEVYLAMAATLRQQKSLETAQIMLRFALSLRPDLTAAKLVLSDTLEADRHWSQALTALATVPGTDPLAAVIDLRRASLSERMGDRDAARTLLERLASEHPDRPEPLAQLAGMLRTHEQFAEAVTAYDRAIARIAAPSRGNWPLFYERGIALERAGQWPRAEADFKFALELAPDQPNVLNYLGYAWADRGEHLEEAGGMVQRAVAQRPNDGSMIDSLGWILLRQGDAPGALKQLERAVELEPEDPVINGHLGDALVAVGRKREAVFQWQRALNLKPDPDDQQAIEAKLRKLEPTAP